MKHIYLHTSNLTDIAGDEELDSRSQYDRLSYIKLLRNELAKFSTKKITYHFLTGDIDQEGCPWCGGSAELKKVYEFSLDKPEKHSEYAMCCTKCKSQGPNLKIATDLENDPLAMDILMDLLELNYKKRSPWDKELYNPYKINLKEENDKL